MTVAFTAPYKSVYLLTYLL